MDRIWHQYLSERDKQHVASKPRRPIGFGSKPALLLIDNYRGVFGDEPLPLLQAVEINAGAIGEEAWHAAERIAELLVAGRRAGLPIIHITGLGAGLSGMPGWSAAVHAGDRFGDLSVDSAQDDWRYEIVEQCAPIEGEVLLRKAAPSAFWGTPLAGTLNFLGVDTLIVAGESTSGCVRASVIDAASYRYRVVVAEECTYDRHQACHAINLFDMHQKYADVLPLADVLSWIDGYGGTTSSVTDVAAAS